MADGSITFSTALDNSDLEKQLKRAEARIESLKRKLESDTDKRTLIEKQMERNVEAIEQAEKAIDKLNERRRELDSQHDSGQIDSTAYNARSEVVAEEIAKTQKELDKLRSTQAALTERWEATGDAIELNREKLAEAESKAKDLGRAVSESATKAEPAWRRAGSNIKTQMGSVADGLRERFSSAANSAAAPWETLGRKIKGMVKKVFLFSVILKGIKAIKSEIVSLNGENFQMTASIANLRAVIHGFLAQVVTGVAPALTAIVNTIAGALERIGGLIDSIFGTNIVDSIFGARAAASAQIQQANAAKMADYQDKVAKAQEKQAKAAKNLAKEQEKANRQLMSFDEINALSEESSEDAADAFDDYADDLGDSVEFPELDTDWTQAFDPGAGVLQSFLDWLDMIRDRIMNDIDGPFARIREGLERIKKGWDELVEGIQTGDWGKIWDGVRDIVVGTLYVIEGTLGAFIDWLDEITGGRFSMMFEGLKQALHGVVEFIEGVLYGDFDLAFQGLYDIVNGFTSFFEGAWVGIFNWLDELTGGQFHDIIERMKLAVMETWEGIRSILNGVVEFIQGVFTGDLDLAMTGIRDILDGISQFAQGIVDTIIAFVKGEIELFFGFLAEKFPALAGFFTSARDFIFKVIDGIASFLKGIMEGIGQLIQGHLSILVGLVTGDMDQVRNGVDLLAGGIRSIVDGLAGTLKNIGEGIFDFIKNGAKGAYEFLAYKVEQVKGSFVLMKGYIQQVLDSLKQIVFNVLNSIPEQASRIIENVKGIFRRGLEAVASIFTQNGSQIVVGLKQVINGYISTIEGVLDGVVYGVVDFANGLIDGLRNIPGVSIPSITFYGVRLPRLAKGAVIPPNREFTAVLGDQSHGRNLEAPEDLIRQIVREESASVLAAMTSFAPQGEGDVNLVLMVDGEELARAQSKGAASLARRGMLNTDVVFT